MTIGYFEKLRILEQAYDDCSLMESAGPSAFESEEEFLEELDKLKTAIYALEEMLAGCGLH